MTFTVIKPGIQSTLQGAPRRGFRHFGIPAAGPADPLSLALANRLLGNPLLAVGVEVTYGGIRLVVDQSISVAVCGADAEIAINDEAAAMHEVLHLSPGDELSIGGTRTGARSYLAVASGIEASEWLGSASTCLPAQVGGFEGRALTSGDRLSASEAGQRPDQRTPDAYRPPPMQHTVLRACASDHARAVSLFEHAFTVAARADRMGLKLCGATLDVDEGRMPSAPVFPGCVQCPPDGQPFLLSVDAQTTGGYAQLAQVVRADRHLAGQLRPGDRLSFAPRTPTEARDELREKVRYWSRWMPGCADVFI